MIVALSKIDIIRYRRIGYKVLKAGDLYREERTVVDSDLVCINQRRAVREVNRLTNTRYQVPNRRQQLYWVWYYRTHRRQRNYRVQIRYFPCQTAISEGFVIRAVAEEVVRRVESGFTLGSGTTLENLKQRTKKKRQQEKFSQYHIFLKGVLEGGLQGRETGTQVKSLIL